MGDKYGLIIEELDKSLTYLFEIVDPQLRIIVDYGQRSDLTMIGVFHTNSGQEIDLAQIDFPNKAIKLEGFSTLDQVVETAKSLKNSEGYIIRWEDGTRAKVKGDWYLRIDSALNGINAIRIWDILKLQDESERQTKMEEFMAKVPNEFLDWVEGRIAKYHNDHSELLETLTATVQSFGDSFESRHIAIGQLSGDSRKRIFYCINKGQTPLMWGQLKPDQNEKPQFG